jgi:hypothetical protein
MAYGFVKQSGGEIALQSVVKQGTCVQICLPRSHGALATDTHPAAAVDLGVETILVVEDEEDVRTAASTCYRRWAMRCSALPMRSKRHRCWKAVRALTCASSCQAVSAACN